jgi:hypothetical protein
MQTHVNHIRNDLSQPAQSQTVAKKLTCKAIATSIYCITNVLSRLAWFQTEITDRYNRTGYPNIETVEASRNTQKFFFFFFYPTF